MANQQIQFAETIRAMKLAIKRRQEDDSDSDTSIHASTNRGHKHQRRAKHVREGHLDDTGGRSAYRKKVNHAGYTRYIISTNPTLYDADGDVVSPTESDNERDVQSIRDNPFGEVQLEHLLRPLTAASELPDHPSLSVPYKSKALTQMAEQAQQMMRREREILWRAKRLLRRFRGDADWVPCETFETEQDEVILLPQTDGGDATGGEDEVMQSAVSSVATEAMDVTDTNGKITVAEPQTLDPEGREENGVEALDMAIQQAAVEAAKTEAEVESIKQTTEQTEPNGNLDIAQNDSTAELPQPLENPALDLSAAEAASERTSNSGKDTTNVHAMTTRARRPRSPAHSEGRVSPTPSDSASIPAIHPWFLFPSVAQPDRDLGLPAPEAEETRRMLLLYVQKQEHVVRQLSTLSDGLLKADRMRREVYLACKAEGHVKDDGRGNMITEMSDGEDWYDPADWGLTERDLKIGRDGRLGLEKGRDEVEEVGEEEARRGGRRRRVNRM